MVLVNCSVEDGDGYIHLVPQEEHEDHPGSLKMLPAARCGHVFMGKGNVTWCRASNAGKVFWDGQPFSPDDLADLILRLKEDGYMCRKCVREHFQAVGGIPGLYHHPWTEDLHREDVDLPPEDALKPVLSSVEIDEVTVMRVGKPDGGETVMVKGTCPTCDSPLSVASEGHETKTVMCTSCTWAKAVDLPKP